MVDGTKRVLFEEQEVSILSGGDAAALEEFWRCSTGGWVVSRTVLKLAGFDIQARTDEMTKMLEARFRGLVGCVGGRR